MGNVRVIGGARIGWLNASFPFAKLTCEAGRLNLACMGTYEFTPAQVVSIKREGAIPLLSWGLRINHNRTDYPEKLVFWTLGNPSGVKDQIAATGFVPSGQPVKRAPGLPFRWSFLITFFVAWNVLFLAGMGGNWQAGSMAIGPLSVATLALVFLLAAALKSSIGFQAIALNPGHSIGEVKSFVTFLQVLTGALAGIFAVVASLGR